MNKDLRDYLRKYSINNHDDYYVNEPKSIDEIVDGSYQKTDFGKIFVAKKEYLPDYYHGEMPLESFLKQSPKTLALISKNDEIKDLDLKKAVFIDTETTGLSGGTGTAVFLVGILFFENNEFRIRQYLMQDFNEELAMLSALKQIFKNFEFIISYNGKAFDIPLLSTRYLINKMSDNHLNLPHIDLLFPSRFLYRKDLPNCRLKTIENKVLGIWEDRIGDIDSSLIPYIYFDFLNTKDARILKSVFKHNIIDLISLVTLTAKLASYIENYNEINLSYNQIRSLTKIFFLKKNFNDAEKLILRAIQNADNKEDLEECKMWYGFILKKMRKFDDSSKIFEELVLDDTKEIEIYRQVAIYQEHQNKNYQKAINFCNKALKIMKDEYNIRRRDYYINDINYRLARLYRKSSRINNKIKEKRRYHE